MRGSIVLAVCRVSDSVCVGPYRLYERFTCMCGTCDLCHLSARSVLQCVAASCRVLQCEHL